MMRKATLPLIIFLLVLVSCGGLLSQEDAQGAASGFHKEMLKEGEEPFTLVLFSDAHFERDDKGAYTAGENHCDMLLWYQDHKDSMKNPLIVNLGDITDNSTVGQYRKGKAFLEGFGTKTLSTLGNHDNRNNGRAEFFDMTGSMYGSYSYCGYTLYLLDSSPRAFSKAQMEKLEKAIQTDTQPKIFLTHYPMAANKFEYYYLALTDSEQRETMIDMMLRNKVGLYLAGHRHKEMGSIAYSDTCNEIVFSSLSGIGGSFPSVPTWYTILVENHKATITRYVWKGDSNPEESLLGTFALPQ